MIDRFLNMFGLIRVKSYERYVTLLRKQHGDYCAENTRDLERARGRRQEHRDKITLLLNLLHSVLHNAAEIEARLIREEGDTGSFKPSYPIEKGEE